MILQIFSLLVLCFIFSGSNQYSIYLGNLFVAEVEISTDNIYYNNTRCKKIDYISHTKSIFQYMYPVSNKHETIFDNNNNEILKYSKNIQQLNINEKFSTYRKNDTTFYYPKKFIIKNTHNIFSLLEHIASDTFNAIDKNYIIDQEGELHTVSVKLIEETNNILGLKIDINFNGTESSDKKYDIFLWGLFLKDYDKYIWVDINEKKIIKCEFKNSFINLSAYLL